MNLGRLSRPPTAFHAVSASDVRVSGERSSRPARLIEPMAPNQKKKTPSASRPKQNNNNKKESTIPALPKGEERRFHWPWLKSAAMHPTPHPPACLFRRLYRAYTCTRAEKQPKKRFSRLLAPRTERACRRKRGAFKAASTVAVVISTF